MSDIGKPTENDPQQVKTAIAQVSDYWHRWWAWVEAPHGKALTGLIRWVRESCLAWLLIIISVIALLAAGQVTWVLIVFGLILIISVYPALPRPVRNWLKNNFFLYVAVIISVFAVIFLALWAVTNLVVPAQQVRVNTLLYDDVAKESVNAFVFGPAREYTLTARYPVLILADVQTMPFTFALHNSDSTTRTITATAPVPVELQRADFPEQRDIAVDFSDIGPGHVVTATFNLVSARTSDGLFWTDIPLTFTLQFMPTLSTSTVVTPTAVALKFQAESAWGQAVRSFVNSTVNEKSPLIILVAALLSGAGAAASSVIKQRREQGEERKQESERLIKQYKDAIRSGDKEAVQKRWQDLDHPDVIERVRVEYAVAHHLWNLVNATIEDNLVQLVKDAVIWPEECACAYLLCHKQLYKFVPEQLRDAKSFIPLDGISESTRGELVKADLQLPSMQVLQWPIPREFGMPPKANTNVQKIRQEGNPFPIEKAEYDQKLLFGKGAFWRGHPLFDMLEQSSRPQIVFGESGSGRSAMALAIGQAEVLGLRFRLYLSGQPDAQQIKVGFVQHLLSCIQAYPTLLSRLSPSEMSLLARVLVNALGKDYALAEISSVQNSDKWLLKVTSEEDKEKWRRTSTAQLTLLGRAVESARADQPADELHWPREIARCAYSLGFNTAPLLLVVDSPSEASTWAQNFWPRFYSWQQAGLVTILFLSQRLEAKIKVSDGLTECHQLEWTLIELQKMVEWRLSSAFGESPRKTISTIFEPGVFEQLLSMSDSNPQRFARVWNACLRQSAGLKISNADLDSALTQV